MPVSSRRWRWSEPGNPVTEIWCRFRTERQRRRTHHCEQVARILSDTVKLRAGLIFELVDAGRDIMSILTRAEQIEILSEVLACASDRCRDTALELICALLPYAKPRANAPVSEIAGVSLFNSIVRRSRRVRRERQH